MDTGGGKKRKIYDLTSKKEIIACAEIYGNRATGRFFGIPESCIRLWRKSVAETDKSQGIVTSPEVSILKDLPKLQISQAMALPVSVIIGNEETNTKSVEGRQKATTGSDVTWYVHLDEELRNYVRKLYEGGSTVLLDEIMLKAYDIIMSLNVSRQDFEISREWVKTFLKYRSSVSYRISKSPRVVNDIEPKLYKYHILVTQLREQHSYPLNQIGNVHEIKLFLDFPPSNDKCITAVLCATADGFKFPPFIIFRSDCVLKKILPRNVIVRTEENGNLNANLMTEWYKLIWCHRPGIIHNPRAMLTLDHSVSHLLTEDWFAEGNSDIIVIPKGMNLIPQPLNVQVHIAFKDNLRWECEKWFLSQGKLKSASASLVLYWIAGAWKNVSEEIVVNSFKKCHLSSDLNSLDAAIYNISENYVIFFEDISISDAVSSGVSNSGNISSAPVNQQTGSSTSSGFVVRTGGAEEVAVANTIEDDKKYTQDPLAFGENSILNKLLKTEKVEPQSDAEDPEISTIMDEVSVLRPSQTSTLGPPKGQVMLMLSNGKIIKVEDALPSTIEQIL